MEVEVLTALITLVVSSYFSYRIAKSYGDVAGTGAAIKYEEEKAARAHIVTLQALLHEVIRIRGLVNHNAKLKPDYTRVQGVVRLPVKSFETAFISGESNLLVEVPDTVETLGVYPTQEPLKSVMIYLTEASYINSLVDVYLGIVQGLGSADKSFRKEIVGLIVDKSEELFEVLKRLEEHLRGELEKCSN